MENKILEISCDESGHTGPDLLQLEQRYFGYASVCIDDNDSWKIIQNALRAYPVQMPELKANKLMKSTNGRRLIATLVKESEGRFALCVMDKLLALCGWIFEYLYEPVFKENPAILYEKNLHRFVAMVAWIWFTTVGEVAEESIKEFQRYMRSLNEKDAPLLFDNFPASIFKSENADAFNLILKFARGYKSIIIKDNSDLGIVLPDKGKWVLDLSAATLWSHLNHWGCQNIPLKVRCDVSKPLQAYVSKFQGTEDDPAIIRARMLGFKEPLGWRMNGPIEFVDSRNHPAVQLADVIAGAAIICLRDGASEDFLSTTELLEKHMLKDSIMPDFDLVDLNRAGPAVNYAILYHLAMSADLGLDPNINLHEVYSTAEAAWLKGKLNF